MPSKEFSYHYQTTTTINSNSFPLYSISAKCAEHLQAAVAYMFPLLIRFRADERYRPGRRLDGAKYIPPSLARRRHELILRQRLNLPSSRHRERRRCYVEQELRAKQVAIEKYRAANAKEEKKRRNNLELADEDERAKRSRLDGVACGSRGLDVLAAPAVVPQRVTYVGAARDAPVDSDEEENDDDDDDDFEDV